MFHNDDLNVTGGVGKCLRLNAILSKKRNAGRAVSHTPGVFDWIDQRLEYCGALRAFLRPYFLRSMARGSRVRKPAFFSAGRSSGCTRISARAMARRSAPA